MAKEPMSEETAAKIERKNAAENKKFGALMKELSVLMPDRSVDEIMSLTRLNLIEDKNEKANAIKYFWDQRPDARTMNR